MNSVPVSDPVHKPASPAKLTPEQRRRKSEQQRADRAYQRQLQERQSQGLRNAALEQTAVSQPKRS